MEREHGDPLCQTEAQPRARLCRGDLASHAPTVTRPRAQTQLRSGLEGPNTCTRMHTHLHVCAHARTYAHVHTHIRVHTPMHVYTNCDVHSHTCTQLCTHTHMHTYCAMHSCMRACKHVHVRTHPHIHRHIHACGVHIDACVPTYTDVHTHVRA